MRKLKLDLNSIKVESFETALPTARDGTVYGHEATDMFECPYTQNNQCPVPTSVAETCVGAGGCNESGDYNCDSIGCGGETELCNTQGTGHTCENTCNPEVCNTFEAYATCVWTSCGTGTPDCYCQ